MDYAEYRFRADALAQQKAQAYKDQMIAASFTAWQIGRQNGLKTDWEKYLSALGLGKDKEKMDIEEKSIAINAALDIHQRIANRGK